VQNARSGGVIDGLVDLVSMDKRGWNDNLREPGDGSGYWKVRLCSGSKNLQFLLVKKEAKEQSR